MANVLSPSIAITSPLAWLGRQTQQAVGYAGGLALVLMDAGRAVSRRDESAGTLYHRVSDELAWMLAMGMPLVALVHAGLGSFLSMQAYFGGTFVDGTGAVVGVGLLRNVAPQMAGLVLAGLLAARMVPELRGKRRGSPQSERPAVSLLDLPKLPPKHETPPPAVTGQEIAARLIAATLAGPVLGLWGAVVGMAVGLKVGHSMLGVTTHSFFLMFWEMLWYRDVVGVPFKGLACGAIAGLIACHEGLRGPADAEFADVAAAACRAACLAGAAVLLITSGWFVLFYHAGPAFGPTLLEPASL